MMNACWPWLAVAGLGFMHGLNPATGWMLATGWALRSGDRARAWWSLLPLAFGHALSIALVAVAVSFSLSPGRVATPILAGGLFIFVILAHRWGHRPGQSPAGHAGLALWSFAMSTAQGAGLMLVPALIPLCTAHATGRTLTASGPVTVALAAIVLHSAAMLVTTGMISAGACRCFEFGAGRLRNIARHPHSSASELPKL